MIIIQDNLTYRLVESTDANFIIKLRTNPKLNIFINPTSSDLEQQKNWIADYKFKEKKGIELYFIFLEDLNPKGTYRLYNINQFSFTIGSWIFTNCQNKLFPIIADIEMGNYGFNILKKDFMIFDVRKNNLKVIKYHLLKKVSIFNEDKDNLYFILRRADWSASEKKLKSLI